MNNERFIDRLFEEDNEDRIYLTDEDGKEVAFEQVALVDYEGGYYALLMPVEPMEGVGEDEVLIFFVDEENDKLIYVEDDEIGEGVMDVFYQMLEEYDKE